MPIRFVPRWEGAIHGHAINRVRAFYPQLASEHEVDDLMHEAYIVFLKCKQRYYGTGERFVRSGTNGRFRLAVDKPAWFMALFMRALQFRMLNLVKKARKYSERPFSIEELGGMEMLSVSQAFQTVEDEAWVLARVISELPREVRELIRDALVGSDSEARAACDALLALPRWMRERIYTALSPGLEADGSAAFRRVLIKRPTTHH